MQERFEAEKAKIATRLEREMADLKPSDPQFQVKLDRLQLAVERLGDFQFQVLGLFQCPVSYLWHGRQSTLRRERFVLDANIFTCAICRYDLSLPV